MRHIRGLALKLRHRTATRTYAPGRTRRTGLAVGLATGLVIAVSAGGTALAGTPSLPSYGSPSHARNHKPITLTVFSPGVGDHSGAGGVGFIVDLALDASSRKDNPLLSAAAGYKPFFHDPTATDFHPGPDQGAPGLVVMLSSTPNMPGTPFQGPRTNLAGLFQINGVAKVHDLAETWNTWQPGKPLFGLNRQVRLTAYVVRGTAPAVLPSHPQGIISNIANVRFTIAG